MRIFSFSSVFREKILEGGLELILLVIWVEVWEVIYWFEGCFVSSAAGYEGLEVCLEFRIVGYSP